MPLIPRRLIAALRHEGGACTCINKDNLHRLVHVVLVHLPAGLVGILARDPKSGECMHAQKHLVLPN